VLQTFRGKEPFSRHGDVKRTGDCPSGRASVLGHGFRFDAPPVLYLVWISPQISTTVF